MNTFCRHQWHEVMRGPRLTLVSRTLTFSEKEFLGLALSAYANLLTKSSKL